MTVARITQQTTEVVSSPLSSGRATQIVAEVVATVNELEPPAGRATQMCAEVVSLYVPPVDPGGGSVRWLFGRLVRTTSIPIIR